MILKISDPAMVRKTDLSEEDDGRRTVGEGLQTGHGLLDSWPDCTLSSPHWPKRVNISSIAKIKCTCRH